MTQNDNMYNNNDTNNVKTMNNNIGKHFNIAEFNKNKVGNKYDFTLPDGMLVKQVEYSDCYQEELKHPNNPNSFVYSFDKNGFLTIEGFNFFDNPVGTWKYYNKSGIIEKEVNWDKPYLFSIIDLAELMKQKYNIDIMKESNLFVFNRFEEKEFLNLPLYEIGVNDPINSMRINYYLINGNNGEVLITTTRTKEYVDGEEPEEVLNEYLRTKNLK
jgi:hypothetical protein